MQTKTFRLFISSPFKDFKKERKVLHTKVFPRIEQYLLEKNINYSFQPIDLRWGVSNEAQLDQKTLEVCLEEVKACKHFPYPNFLIMTGDRYGYIPLPYMIEKKEFDEIYKYLTNKRKISLNEQEIIKYWYRLDENQIPASYILQKRDDQSNNKDIEEYLRQDYKTLDMPEDKDVKEWNKAWGEHETLILQLFQDAVENIDLESKEKDKYFTSATEAEVLEGIIDYKDITPTQNKLLKEKVIENEKVDKEYIFGYTRTIEDANGNYVDWNENLKSKAQEFKDNINHTLSIQNRLSANFSSIEEYEKNKLKEFEEFIYEKLVHSITTQKDKLNNITPLEQEIKEQQKFQQDKKNGFQGRKNTLDKIEKYINDENTTLPLVIYGLSGMGKSSLMAKAIDQAEEALQGDIIYRFVGATAQSTTIRDLLISICDQLQNQNIIDKVEEYELEQHKFDKQIRDILSSINKPVTLFIDALDQLAYKDYLSCLPDTLPKSLKLILSVLKDDKYQDDSEYYNSLEIIYDKKSNSDSFIDITTDSLQDQKEDLVKELLEKENRTLNDQQTKYLLEQWEKTNYSPLYLKIAIEEVKHWRSYDQKEKNKLNNSVESIVLEYIENLKELYHHDNIFVDKVLGYIHTSKDGLSEKELLDIISEDLDDDKTFKKSIINEWHEPIIKQNPRRDNKEELIVPISLWSRLHTQIKPFLITRNIDNQSLMKFFHRQFTIVIDNYVKDQQKDLHIKLVDYFFQLQDKTKTWDKRYHNLHMLNELPYHLFHSKQSNKLKEILFDLEFAGSIYNNHKQEGFRDIMSKATTLPNITEDEIYPWESFYREKEHLILRIDEGSWKPHQSLFQLAYEDGLNSPLTKNSKLVLENNNVNWYWLKSMYIRDSYYRSGLKEWFSIEESYIPYEVKNIILLENNDLIITMKDFNHDGYKEKHNFFYRESETKRISQIDREKISSYKTKIVKQNNLYSCKKVFDSFLYKISVEDDELIIYDKLLKKYKFISIAGYRINGFKVLSKNLLMITFSGLNFGIFDIFCINDVEYINDHFILDKFFKYKNYLLGLQNKNLVLFDINEENIVFKYNIEKYNIENLLLVNDYIVIFWTATNIYMLDITSTKLELIYNLEIKIKDFLTVKFNNILFWLDNDDLLYLDIKKLSFKKIEVPIDRFYDIVDGKYLIEKVKISNDEYIKWDLSCNYFSYLYEDKIYDFGVTYGDPNSFDYFEILFKTGEEIKIKKETNKGYISFYGMKKYENQSIEKIDFSFSDFSIKYRKDSLNKKFKQFFKFDNNISTLTISGTFSYKNEILNWSTDNKSYISTSYNDFQNTLEINDDIKFIINENKIDVETKNKKIIQEQLESINIKFNNKEQLDLIHDFKENIICKQALIFNFLFIPMLEIKDDILFVFFEEKVKPYKMYFGNKDISTNNIIINEIDNHNSKIKSHNEII